MKKIQQYDEYDPSYNGSFTLRLIGTPFIFLWGLFLTFALMFVILPFIMVGGLFAIISMPIIWFLIKSGSKVEYLDPMFNYFEKDLANHFLSITIPIWMPFGIAFLYLKEGIIFTGQDILKR